MRKFRAKSGQRREPDRAILDRDRFQRIVAHAALAADEQHAGRAEAAHDHRVVPGPRGQQPRGDVERLDRPRQSGDDAGIADESVRLMGLGNARADAARTGDGVDRRRQVGERDRPLRVVRRAKIDGKARDAGDDVGGAGPDFETPDRGDQIGLAARARLDRQRHFRGGRQRVAAQIHRRRAGVPGHAVDRDLEPRRAADRGDDADRQTLGFQDRALFDMRLDEGGDIVRADRSRLLGIAAEGLQRVAHRDAARVLLVERGLRIGPGERARAGERGPKTNAFLVAEADDFDRVLQPLAALAERLDDGERGQRAVIAVVTPGVAHRVDMRAQHQSRRARAPSLIARDHVAGGVDPRLEPRLGAPADQGSAARRCASDRKSRVRRPGSSVKSANASSRAIRRRPASSSALGEMDAHQFRAVRGSSQRPSVARSSSVMPLKLLGGIAWVKTACIEYGGREAGDVLGRVEEHALGRLADLLHRLGRVAHHAARLHDIDHLRRGLRQPGDRDGGR